MGILFFAPSVIYAQGLSDAIQDAYTIVNYLIILLSAAAIMVFFFGIVRFISRSGSEEAKEEGRRTMLWGTIALFIIFSLWAIIGLIQGDLTLVGSIENVDIFPKVQTR